MKAAVLLLIPFGPFNTVTVCMFLFGFFFKIYILIFQMQAAAALAGVAEGDNIYSGRSGLFFFCWRVEVNVGGIEHEIRLFFLFVFFLLPFLTSVLLEIIQELLAFRVPQWCLKLLESRLFLGDEIEDEEFIVRIHNAFK